MLTLKELKKIVKVADVEKRIPSVKSLKEHKVVAVSYTHLDVYKRQVEGIILHWSHFQLGTMQDDMP